MGIGMYTIFFLVAAHSTASGILVPQQLNQALAVRMPKSNHWTAGNSRCIFLVCLHMQFQLPFNGIIGLTFITYNILSSVILAPYGSGLGAKQGGKDKGAL